MRHCITPYTLTLLCALCLLAMVGKKTDSLAHLWHAKYKEATCKNEVQPESLPPTEHAVYFDSIRGNLQVSQWKYLDLECLQPVD